MAESTFFCTLCGHKIIGNDTFYGSTFTCPACGVRVTIPAMPATAETGASEPAPAAAPQAAVQVEPAVPVQTRELTILEFAPTRKAHLAEMIGGGALTLVGGVTVLWLWISPARSNWWIVLAAPAVLAGVYLLAKLWIDLKSMQYRLTNQRLFVLKGLFSKETQELELFRIKDIAVQQSLLQRVLGYGQVTIVSSDDTTPVVTLRGIANPIGIKELVRENYKEARKALGLRATEFIQS
ncbi:MAG: PH domain-containing protein [bacterium]|nr:PH domain-containing protein [bacterium]